jgi:hypothetical protein
MTFDDLVLKRWKETARAVGFDATAVDLGWRVSDDYPHFRTPRGFGVTFWEGQPPCKLMFSTKILSSPFHRADGVLRHELGHVVDMVFPKHSMDEWAVKKGVVLATTDERRADDIALAIWGEPIRYDDDLIQSTRYGVTPRPRHLGL